MKAEVESVGKFEKSVRIEVPAERVDHELDHVVSDLRRQARIKGFRPGKAPEGVILRMYADYIDSHAKEHLIGETLPELLEKESLVPVSEPVIDAPSVSRGTPFSYTARFEARPKVVAKDYAGIELKKETPTVTDEEVTERLSALRQEHAQLRGLPEDHEADLGDTLLCQYRGTLGGEVVEGGSEQDAQIELGSGGHLPGLDEHLKGIRAGQERQVRYRLPEDSPDERLAGKEVDLHFQIHSIRRKELPPLDDEFAKDLGHEGLGELKEKLRAELQAQAERHAREKLREAALKELIGRNPIGLPPAMIESQSRQMIAQIQQRLALQGLSLPSEGAQPEELKQSVRDDATAAVQRHLLLQSVAEQEKIEVPEQDIENRLHEMAKAAGQPYEKLRAVYKERGWIEQLRGQLREQRALDFVLEKARIS